MSITAFVGDETRADAEDDIIETRLIEFGRRESERARCERAELFDLGEDLKQAQNAACFTHYCTHYCKNIIIVSEIVGLKHNSTLHNVGSVLCLIGSYIFYVRDAVVIQYEAKI